MTWQHRAIQCKSNEKQRQTMSNNMNDYKKSVIIIAESLKKNNEKISMETFRKCAQNNNIEINDICYGTIVKTLKSNGYEFNKIFDKSKFAKRREEMALLTHQGWTLQMIANKYGITRQAVSLLLKKAASEGQIVVKSKRTRSDPEEKNVIYIRRKKTKTQCVICGKTHYGKNKTCSAACLRKLNDKKIGGEWSRVETVELTCSYCNKKFTRTKHLQKVTEIAKRNSNKNYCSRSCYHKSREIPVQGVLLGS